MNLDAPTLWWLAVGALVAAELATGTFYLLMLGLGAAAGALAAHAGVGMTAQLVAASLVGGGAVAGWYAVRKRQPVAAPAASNRDVNLDVGQHLHVTDWNEDGSARVSYRGASWAVRYAGAGQPVAGDHVIVALDGNELRVAPASR
jgi:membrane protein implicated in regulation of membrane protease activity